MVSHKRYERGAKARALIISILKGPVEMTGKELSAQPQIATLELKQSAIDAILSTMFGHGQISRRKDGSRNVYFEAHSQSLNDMLPKVTRTEKTYKLQTPNALQVDYIKSTGRVRITMDAMVIEIGILP